MATMNMYSTTMASAATSSRRMDRTGAVDVANGHHTTHLTFSRSWLVHLANETVEIARSGHYVNRLSQEVSVKEALQDAIDNSVHYHESHVFSAPTKNPNGDNKNNNNTRIIVCYGTSIEVAAKLHHAYSHNSQQHQQQQQQQQQQHIGILNSASGKNPGGKFFRGTVSQEDRICRACLLYPCLLKFYGLPDYYYEINSSAKYMGSSSSCAIFSHRVPVIRQDTMEGPLLDDYYTSSIVSIPAPNAFVLGKAEDAKSVHTTINNNNNTTPAVNNHDNYDDDKEYYESQTLKEAMHNRIFRALCILHQHGCTDVVLCAYGCGVHGNNPRMVAEIFREALDTDFKGCFQTVVFAIQPSRHANYRAFTSAFPDAAKAV